MLAPDAVFRIASAIVAECGEYRRTVAAGTAALSILRQGVDSGLLTLSSKEQQWFSRLETEMAALPPTEDEFFPEMQAKYGHLFDAASYGLPAPAATSTR